MSVSPQLKPHELQFNCSTQYRIPGQPPALPHPMPFLTSFVLLPRKLHRASASFTPAGSGTSAKRELWVKPSEELDSCLVPSCHQVWSHRPGGKERIRKVSPGSALPDTGQDAAHQGSSAPVGCHRGSAAAETIVSPPFLPLASEVCSQPQGSCQLEVQGPLNVTYIPPSSTPAFMFVLGNSRVQKVDVVTILT